MNSPVNLKRVWFGPIEDLSVSFRHDLAGNPGLSAAAHRHQVPLGIVFQAGWFLVYSSLVALVQHPVGYKDIIFKSSHKSD